MNRTINYVWLGIMISAVYMPIPLKSMHMLNKTAQGQNRMPQPAKAKTPPTNTEMIVSPKKQTPVQPPIQQSTQQTALVKFKPQAQSVKSLQKNALKELIESFITTFGNAINPEIKQELVDTITPKPVIPQAQTPNLQDFVTSEEAKRTALLSSESTKSPRSVTEVVSKEQREEEQKQEQLEKEQERQRLEAEALQEAFDNRALQNEIEREKRRARNQN